MADESDDTTAAASNDDQGAQGPPAARREALAIGVAWGALGIVEVVLAYQALVRPTPTQVAFELFALAVLGVAQWRYATGIYRSVLWPGLLAAGMTAMVFGPTGVFTNLIFVVGLYLTARYFVSLVAQRVGPDPEAALLFSVAMAVFCRWLVLSHAHTLESDQLHGAVAVKDAEARLWADVSGPFKALRRPEPGDGPPLVLITIDTLRADHAEEMESYKRLVERGHGWPRAASTSSWTLPAIASAHTGAMPSVHGADARPGGHYQGIDPDVPMVAEELLAAGYTTAAVVTNPWLEGTMGFERGFVDFEHANEAFPHRLMLAGMPQGPLPIDAEAVVDGALRVLDRSEDRGLFLWVHLLDPHMPYFHAEEPPGLGLMDGDLRSGKLTTEQEREAIMAAYAAEVAHTDAHLSRLLDALSARGVLDDGLVIFAADHGEEFWDHGGAEHGHSHHTEVVDVAMAVAGAGITGRPGGVASLVDVRSTLRAAAGLDPGGIDLRGGVPLDRVATTYGNNYFRIDRSARSARSKVIVYGSPWQGPAVVAFDLTVDPMEQRPLLDPPEAAVLRAALDVQGPDLAEAAAINEDALRALGYVQ